MNEVTLFRYFPTKEILLRSVIERYSFLPRLRELIPKVDPMPYSKALKVIARNFLKQRQKAGEIRRLNEELTTRAFFGMLFSYFTTTEFCIRKDVRQGIDRAINEFVEIFVKGTEGGGS